MDDRGEGRGGAFYEDPDALDAYLAHRHAAVSSPNLVMEDPAFERAVGDLADRRILEIGCGDGTFARTCADSGCANYVGIDASRQMIERARASSPARRLRFDCLEVEDYEPSAGSFDLVAARMVLHYVDDLGAVLDKAHRALAADGRLVFTVVHPVVTAGDGEPEGPRRSQVVTGYFEPGERPRRWFGRPVVWQHRTIEQYLEAVKASGFVLDAFSECPPHESRFDGNADEFNRRLQVPLFLLVGATVGDR